MQDGPSLSQGELLELELRLSLASAIERACAAGEWEVVRRLTECMGIGQPK